MAVQHGRQHGRTTWPYNMAVQHGRTTWPYNMAVQHGRTTWPYNMAVQHGRTTWPYNMAVQHGRTTWPYNMAVQHGRTTWPYNMAVQHGRTTWLYNMAVQHGQHSVLELTSLATYHQRMVKWWSVSVTYMYVHISINLDKPVFPDPLSPEMSTHWSLPSYFMARYAASAMAKLTTEERRGEGRVICEMDGVLSLTCEGASRRNSPPCIRP